MIASSLISLAVICDNPFAEIFIIDGEYRLVARGIGNVKASVVPGVFKVKTRVGRLESEEIHLCEVDTTLNITTPKQASPIPAYGTAKTHEYQSAAAEALSKTPKIHMGSGAEMFLMARRWSSPHGPEGEQRARNPAAAMKLMDSNGALVVDFGASSTTEPNPAFDAWAACTVSLRPGLYVLRTALRAGFVADQTVFASRGWQLQLFFLDEPSLDDAGDRGESDTVDLSVLSNMAISMARIGSGFDSSDNRTANADLVRVALADGRAVFSGAVVPLMNELLYGKFDNPMLGIFGAHLMLMGRDYLTRPHDEIGAALESSSFSWVGDERLYDEVITNLRKLLGPDHSDVEALSLKSMNRALQTTKPVLAPPMLRASWSLLVDASNDNPQLVSLGLWERIATMVPAGPFLVWQPTFDVSDESDTAPAMSALFVIPSLDLGGGDVPQFGQFGTAGRGSHALKRLEDAMPLEIRDSLQSDAERRQFAIRLDVPRAAIDSVLGSH